MNSKIKLLSLFSGCGGMDLGFEGNFYVHKDSVNYKIHPQWETYRPEGNMVKLPGTSFEIVFANDILREARAAWEPYFNRKGIFSSESIVDLVKKAEDGTFNFPDVDIVTGGFPCQDFSIAGKRKGFNSYKSHLGDYITPDDPTIENRGQLYIWMKKVIEITRPKIFIAENVKGLSSLSDVKKIIQNDFSNINNGYHVFDAKILNAADYGVPQSRERVIFIGVNKESINKEYKNKLDKLNLYPQRTHSEAISLFDLNLKPYVKLEQIFKDLKEPDEASDLEQRSYSKAKWYGKHCQGNKEVNLSSISPTIRAEHHGNIEFRRLTKEHGGKYLAELDCGCKERRLTIRECARIQTFPDNFKFIRSSEELGKEYSLSTTGAYKIIGNAVPPLLAFHIAWEIQENWNKIFGDKSDNIRKQDSIAASL